MISGHITPTGKWIHLCPELMEYSYFVPEYAVDRIEDLAVTVSQDHRLNTGQCGLRVAFKNGSNEIAFSLIATHVKYVPSHGPFCHIFVKELQGIAGRSCFLVHIWIGKRHREQCPSCPLNAGEYQSVLQWRCFDG